MRRLTSTTQTREQCLARAVEFEWGAENSRTREGAAWAWDQARYWRSLALVARAAAGESRTQDQPALREE